MHEFLDFASRGRNAWWRYIVSLVLACMLAFTALVILSLVLTARHLLPPDILADVTQPKNPMFFYPWIAVSFGAFMVGLMIAAAVVQRKHPSDVIGRWRWNLFFWGLGVWAAVEGVLVLIDVLIAPKGFSVSANGGTTALAASALIGLLVQTFAEEFIFRGYITQGILLALKKPLPAAIVSGLSFGAVHFANGLPQTLNAVVFGIVCSLIAIRTGGIALTCGLHLTNNYFGAVLVVSAGDVFRGSPGIITQNTPQLMWWDTCLAAAAMLGLLWPILKRKGFAVIPRI